MNAALIKQDRATPAPLRPPALRSALVISRHRAEGIPTSVATCGQLTRKVLNMDSALATSSVDAARVEAGIAYLAGKSCRARARCPCIVEML